MISTSSSRYNINRIVRLMTDAVPVALYVYDLDRKVIYANQAFTILTGYSLGELRTRPYPDFFHPEDRNRVAAIWEGAFRGTMSADQEFRIITKEGWVTWCASTWAPLLNREGRQIGVQGRDVDITGRRLAEEKLLRAHDDLEQRVAKRTVELTRANEILRAEIAERERTEQALRLSELRYRRITKAVSDYIYTVTVDESGAIHTRHGPACLAVTGHTAEDFAADPHLWTQVVVEEDRDLVRRHTARILSGEDPGPIQHRIRRKDGIVRWVNNCPVLDRSSRRGIVSFDGLIRDITERKQAEEALRESEEIFRQLTESIREVYWVRDVDTGRIVYVSPAYEEIWGRSCLSLYDRPESLLGAVHPQDADRVREAARDMGFGHFFDEEFRIIRPDGAVRWIRARKFSVANPRGGVCRTVGVAEDITERKRAESSLRRYADHLQALSSRLLAVRETERRSIARELHDEIGQLLTGLKLGLDLLGRTMEGAAADNVLNLQTAAAEILEKVRSLSLRLHPSMLDDLGLLPTLSWYFDRWQSQTGIKVFFRHDGLDRRFHTDVETVAYRTIMEALTNVARHAHVEEVNVTVGAKDHELHLIVADAGTGFDPAHVLDGKQSLGLFVMRERVEAIGGRLTVKSAPGAGTLVMATIPCGVLESGGSSHVNDDRPGR